MHRVLTLIQVCPGKYIELKKYGKFAMIFCEKMYDLLLRIFRSSTTQRHILVLISN